MVCYSQNFLFVLLLLVQLTCVHSLGKQVTKITCDIGWGQRSLTAKNGVSWPRTCQDSHYCFEAVTDDISAVRRLIDYPWDPYYFEFYIKGCGGTFGMPNQIHPFKENPKLRKTPLAVKVDITTPKTVTGHGSTEKMSLKYHCREDYCSGASSVKSISAALLLVCMITTMFLL